jgi:hypothetical protein
LLGCPKWKKELMCVSRVLSILLLCKINKIQDPYELSENILSISNKIDWLTTNKWRKAYNKLNPKYINGWMDVEDVITTYVR